MAKNAPSPDDADLMIRLAEKYGTEADARGTRTKVINPSHSGDVGSWRDAEPT
jgi:hypothetical protein